MAGAGVAAGVSNAVFGGIGGPAAKGLAQALDHGVAGIAGALVGAATVTVLNGKDFGANLLTLLPQVIGQTVGQAVTSSINLSPSQTAASPQAASNQQATDAAALGALALSQGAGIGFGGAGSMMMGGGGGSASSPWSNFWGTVFKVGQDIGAFNWGNIPQDLNGIGSSSTALAENAIQEVVVTAAKIPDYATSLAQSIGYAFNRNELTYRYGQASYVSNQSNQYFSQRSVINTPQENAALTVKGVFTKLQAYGLAATAPLTAALDTLGDLTHPSSQIRGHYKSGDTIHN